MKVYENERTKCGPLLIQQSKFQVNKTDTNLNNIIILEDNNPGVETSLRHFFYLEYRKGQPKYAKSA